VEAAATPPPVEPSPSPPAAVPRFDPANILWYFGAIAATFAANVVIGQTSDAHRGIWIFLVGLLFLAGAAALAALSFVLGYWVPAGVLTAATVGLVPVVAIGFEHLLGVWPKDASAIDPFSHFEGAPFSVAVVALLAGLAAFWLVRFGFVLLPVAAATLLAVQFFLPVLVDNPSAGDHEIALVVTGGAFVVIGMLLDARRQRSAAFWWHVVGLVGIAEALAYYATRHELSAVLPEATGNESSWAWVAIFVIGAALLVAAFAVRRSTWAVFGVMGVYATTLHYVVTWTGSWRSPLVMVFVAVALIVAGIVLDLYGGAWPQALARPIGRPRA
jgi:hypothetical protein